MSRPAGPGRALVLAPRVTDSSERLGRAARRRGMDVHRLTGRRVPPDFAYASRCHLYAGPLYADRVAADLGTALLEAPVSWLPGLPFAWTRRRIELTTLAEARRERRPIFAKPPNDKSFPAALYADGSRLPGSDAADDDAPVLISDTVRFLAEYRLFILDGEVLTGSRYATDGRIDIAPLGDDPRRRELLDFAARLLDACADTLPSAVVIDVGPAADPVTSEVGWAVVEANAGWGSGGYAGDPDLQLEVLLRAGGPAAHVRDRDRPFVRCPPTRPNTAAPERN